MSQLPGDTRIAVVGLGAIGLSVTADLIAAGHNPQLCVRRPFDRVVQRRPGESSDQSVVDAPATCVTEVDSINESADWVFLATKAHQTASAQPWLDALCGPNTVVVVLQNGVDHVDRVAPLIGAAEVLPAVVRIPALRLEDGVVERAASGALGVPDGDSGHRLAALFAGSQLTVQVLDDWVSSAWMKLMVNAATGGIGALVVQTNRVLEDAEVADLARRVMDEVAAVGRAEGAQLDDGLPEKMLGYILDSSADHWSSIVVDRRDGRPLEWEARNAVVGRLGRRHGIPTPLNDVLTTLLRVADPAWAAT